MATLPFDHDAPAVQADNLLGVCAAIAEVTGVPAILIRVAFVLAMLGLSFEGTIAAYLVLGAAVFVGRLDWRLPGNVGKRR